MNLEDIENLKSLVAYEPSTGSFVWRRRDPKIYHRLQSASRFNNTYAGKRADSLCPVSGYRRVKLTLNGETRQFSAHRLAWALACGEWPRGNIDHLNRDRGDNRIQNLRVVTHGTNSRNKTTPRNSSSGFTGVGYCRSRKKWVARIVPQQGYRKHLGYFDTFEDAKEARIDAEIKFGYLSHVGA